MRVLDVGGNVFLLRFLPDSRRLVVATSDKDRKVTFAVLSLTGGERVALKVPRANLDSWWYHARYGNAVAAHPAGEVCWIAWGGRLHAFLTATGKPHPVPKGVKAHQVVLSPDGGRLVAAHPTDSHRELVAVTTGPNGGAVAWRKAMPAELEQVAGFLPDGERFVTVDGAVRVRSFDSGEQLTAGRARPVGTQHPQISRDGRHLGLVGYRSMYFWDLTTLEKPRRITGSSAFGDFRSFAFHPNREKVAIIYAGPTLVKEFDLATLERRYTWKWKLGPLRSVAFSPDGCLGAAGSDGGQVVVWDVDG